MFNRHRRATLLFLGVLLLGMRASTANADTIYVCWDGSGDYVTIQAGIDAASDGDEVVVCDGTYTGPGNRDLDFGGKAITVRSANGPENCIIDCQGSDADHHRGFYFRRGEVETSIVDGFTITNGYCTNGVGGGIRCHQSSPTITNCTITENSGGWCGGGVYCSSAAPLITNCAITDNLGSWRGGGVACHFGASPTITNCTITGNAAQDAGGGVYCENSSPTISSCTISGNMVTRWDGRGAGLGCVDSSPTIASCTIAGNTASYGAGVYCDDSHPTITNCTIMENTASHGAGVYCEDSSPTIVNCTIAGNAARVNEDEEGRGAGIYCHDDSSPTITNCTIMGNTAVAWGGGVYCEQSSLTITNCILWDDSALYGPEIALTYGATLVVSYSDVEGGEGAAYVEDGSTLSWGDGNIVADPMFAFTADPHLMPASPCIDAGTNDPPGGLPPEDPDGNPRPLDGDGDSVAIADMGVYEFNPAAASIACSPAAFEFSAYKGDPGPEDQVLSVRNCGAGTLQWEILEECSWLEVDPTSGQSAGEIDEVTLSVDISGLSHGTYTCTLAVVDPQAVNSPRTLRVTLHLWSGYPTIQSLIDTAQDGDEVLVADGLYTGPANKNLDFDGKAITVRSINGPDNCIIDCGKDGRGFCFHSGETAESVVDGFTIRNGRVDRGAGVYCCGSGPTITNCVIVGNAAYESGGGVYATSDARGSCGSLTLIDCVIRENTAVWSGGGISCFQCPLTLTRCALTANVVTGVIADHTSGGGLAIGDADAVLTDCAIAGNTVAGTWHTVGSGGGVRCVGSLMATNCTITGNTITVGEWGNGGGIRCVGALILVNSTITHNTSAYSGGGADVYYGSAEIINCTFSGNSAPSVGGAIQCYSSTTTVCNCVLWGDVAQKGPEISFGDSDVTVGYCDIQGGWTGTGNIDADPLFVDPDGPDDDPNTWEDNDYHLSPGSPCIDAGCNWGVPSDLADLDDDGDTTEITPLDLDGEGRFFDDLDTDDTGYGCPPIVDMGAYEFGATGPQPCPGDLDCDRQVGPADLGILLADWGHGGGDCPGDLDCDGDIDQGDLGILLAHWGEVCP